MASIWNAVKKTFFNFWTVKNLKRRVPITAWLPNYKLEMLLEDFIAGISVGLTAIPQGIAYAGVAGLPLQYGLYSGFMSSFVYIIFGSCKDVTIGPTAILALLVQKFVLDYGDDFAVLHNFLSGCVILLLGIFNLGFLIEFISMPVTTGFTTAAALTIGFSQLHSFLGFAGRSNTFLDVWINFIKNVNTVKLWDPILGVGTILFLLLLKHLGKYGKRTCGPEVPWHKSLLQKLNWLLCLSRNAIAIILGCLLAWILERYDLKPFALTGTVAKGLPPFGPPPFETTHGNTTYEFIDMVEILNTNIITLSLVSVLEIVAISKAFSKGKIVDCTQEMCALGLCNIIGSFARSMPTTGSFTRTVINNASGVRTTLGGIFTGGLVLMALSFLTDYFYYIPKAVLAGLIITAMAFMVEYEVIPLFWRTKKIELLPYFGTVIICLLVSLDIGIVVGICLSILTILATSARPTINTQMIKVNSHEVLVVVPDDSLVYCSADHFYKSVTKIAQSEQQINNTNLVVIFDGSKIKKIDVTVAKSFKILLQTLKSRQQRVFLQKFQPSVQKILIGVYPDSAKMFVDYEDMEEILCNGSDEPNAALLGISVD